MTAPVVTDGGPLRELAETGAHRDLWVELIDRSAEPGLPAGVHAEGSVSVLRSREQLARSISRVRPAMRRRGAGGTVVFAIDAEAEELWGFASGLAHEQRMALDALLVRALHPARALGTWPDDAVFSEREREILRALPEPVRDVAEVRGGRPQAPWGIDYAGYACVIMKITRLCNLRCEYCNDWRAGAGQRMPFEVQARLFAGLLQSPGQRVVDVVWHGGEPTLMGTSAFLRVLALQERFRRPGQLIRNHLQTNGTRLDDAWVRLLARHRFSVGVSLDGPKVVHDAVRVDTRGRPTFERACGAIRGLRDAGILSQVLIVVSPGIVEHGAAALMAFLREERITRVGMLAMRPGGAAESPEDGYLSVPEYARFLLDVQRERLAHPEPWIEVRELDEPLRALRGERPDHCELLGGCVGAFFSVDTDGTISHCDKYVGDGSFVLGSVFDDDFAGLRASPAAERLAAANHDAALGWEAACPYFHACRGWCPHERHVREKQLGRARDGCCGLDVLFEGLAAAGAATSGGARRPR